MVGWQHQSRAPHAPGSGARSPHTSSRARTVVGVVCDALAGLNRGRMHTAVFFLLHTPNPSILRSNQPPNPHPHPQPHPYPHLCIIDPPVSILIGCPYDLCSCQIMRRYACRCQGSIQLLLCDESISVCVIVLGLWGHGVMGLWGLDGVKSDEGMHGRVHALVLTGGLRVPGTGEQSASAQGGAAHAHPP